MKQKLWQTLITYLAYCIDKELYQAIEYLREQIRVFMEQPKNAGEMYGAIYSGYRSGLVSQIHCGFQKIMDQIVYLEYNISKSTVKNILIENGYDPEPDLTIKTTWNEFIRSLIID